MQGKSRMDRELLDAGEMAGHLVPPGSVFAFFRLSGGGSCSAIRLLRACSRRRRGARRCRRNLVGSVLVLKELYDLSDIQTADALKFDIRWKVACGRSLTQMSFDPSTLVYWRKRIAAPSARPDRVLERGRGGDHRDRDPARAAETVRGLDGLR